VVAAERLKGAITARNTTVRKKALANMLRGANFEKNVRRVQVKFLSSFVIPSRRELHKIYCTPTR
jgi:hypothetical protein